MAPRQTNDVSGWRGRFFRIWPTIVLWVAMIVYAWFFTYLSDIKASNFDVYNHDLSHMWQSVWNVGHGHGLTFTLTGDTINIPRLSVHTDYFLVLLAPLSYLWPHFTLLLFIQAVVVAAGAWFVERLARRWTGHRLVALAFALAYLLYGPLQFSVLWQFHAVTLAITFILAAVEALAYRRRSWVVWLWFGLALITKEQVGLIAGSLLWFVARWSDQKRVGWWLGGVGIAYSMIHFLVVIPAWRDSGNSHFVWEFYYGNLGATLPEQLRHLLVPRELIARLWQVQHLKNFTLLVLPLAFLSLLEPVSWLAIVAIVPHWLSDNGSQQSLLRVNHLLAVVVLMVAALRTGQRILIRGWLQPPALVGLVLGAAIIGSVVMSPFRWSVYSDPLIHQRDQDVAAMRRAHRLVPATAVVGYSYGAGAEWRDREFAFLLPTALNRLDYAVVFTSQRSLVLKKFKPQDDRLNQFFQSTPAFRSVYTQGRLAIYRRDHTTPLPPLPDVEL